VVSASSHSSRLWSSALGLDIGQGTLSLDALMSQCP
jgi:hypothetical protein